MILTIKLEYNEILVSLGDLSQVIVLNSPTALSQALLTKMDLFLTKAKKQKLVISGIKVSQTGPSFSSLRAVLTFVNLFAKQNSLPLYDLETGERIKLAVPKYTREPNITKPKK